MRQKTLHYLLVLAVAGIGLAGCRSDVNLNNITVDSKVNAKIGLPIGDISATLGNLLGMVEVGEDTKLSVVYDDEVKDSILLLTIDKHYDNEFHAIELTDYTGNVDSESPVKKVISSDFIPANTKEMVPFDMPISFDGVNNVLSHQRLDSMVIDSASFTTRVSTVNFGLTDNDIDSVVMVLGPQFRRAKGTRQNLPNFKLDKDITIKLDNFTLVMMKDEKGKPGIDNVVDTASIRFEVYLNYLPGGNPYTDPYIPIYDNSAFHFKFTVEMMEYKALYGYFEPGSETHDINTISVPFALPGNESFVLAAKEPKIRMTFTHGLAMPLEVHINEIKAIHPDETSTPATWNGSPSVVIPLMNTILIDEPLDTYKPESILFSEKPDSGKIDTLFKHEVKKIGYDYKLDVDLNREVTMSDGHKQIMDQFRMTHYTDFGMDFHFEMPFKFNKELSIAYTDTIENINLERVQLDSLAAMVPGGIVSEIDSANLWLYLTITNEIPVSLSLDATFLKENNDTVKIAGLHELKGIKITGASASNPVVTIPVSTSITTKDFDELAQTRSMRIRVHLGDDVQESTFVTTKQLRIKAGITADLQAVLNLNNLTNNNNNNQ